MRLKKLAVSSCWPFAIGVICLAASGYADQPMAAISALSGAGGIAAAASICLLRYVSPRMANAVTDEAEWERLMRLAISWLAGAGAAAGCGLFVTVYNPAHGMLISLMSLLLTVLAFSIMLRVSLIRRAGKPE